MRKGEQFNGATVLHVVELTNGNRRMYLSDGRSVERPAAQARPVTGRGVEMFRAGIGSGSFGASRTVRASDTRLRGPFGARRGDRMTERWSGEYGTRQGRRAA